MVTYAMAKLCPISRTTEPHFVVFLNLFTLSAMNLSNFSYEYIKQPKSLGLVRLLQLACLNEVNSCQKLISMAHLGPMMFVKAVDIE